jgi:hypothetical protein
MTFALGILVGILVTVGTAIVVASDVDKDNNQF